MTHNRLKLELEEAIDYQRMLIQEMVVNYLKNNDVQGYQAYKLNDDKKNLINYFIWKIKNAMWLIFSNHIANCTNFRRYIQPKLDFILPKIGIFRFSQSYFHLYNSWVLPHISF